MNAKKNTRSVIKLPMEHAAVTLFAMGINSYYQYTKLCANGDRPDFLPSSLTTYYPNYPGWDAFHELGKKASKVYKPFFGISYDEVKKVVHEDKINTKGAYVEAFKLHKLPPGTPADPESYFKEFEGWDLFLAPKNRFISFDKAKAFIKPYKLTSSYQWRNFCREGRKPGNIPVLPDRDYSEFSTWANFLGYDD